ncbi:hypothetical protein AWENTII_013003 [Aspergillus wentii]
MFLFGEMRRKRRVWTRAIEKAKTTHWREFLDKAGEGHLWKVASYMNPRDNYANIPPLKDGTEEVSDNEAKGELFLETFFPRMADPEESPITPQREEIPWEPVEEHEIHKALRAAKGTTGPGEDRILTLVWKRLWPYISGVITRISLHQSS